MPSFDVAVKVDMQEVLNAVDQVKREINTRYDFRGSKCTCELDKEKGEVTLLAEDDMKIKALQEVLKQKMAKRKISLKSVEFEEPEKAAGGMIKQLIKIKQSLTTDELKKLTKLIKKGMKVGVAIQEDKLRVSDKKRDTLQQVIAYLKEEAAEYDLSFDNFRD